MTLSLSDGKLFFELMWKLQYYANQKRGFHKNITSVEEYANLPTQKKLQVRDEIWKSPALIREYVQENPDSLSADTLELIQKWQNFVKGSFFILRHLKKGSVFIGKDNQVYMVQGIQDPLDEVIPAYVLPQMVEAVLLPFKGRITYDGLLSGYSVHFGGGIRSGLNHTYTVAKHKDRIISTLEPELVPATTLKLKKTIIPQLKELSGTMAKLKGDSAIQNAALALARASIDLSLAEAEETFTTDRIEAQARKILRTSTRLLNLLDMERE